MLPVLVQTMLTEPGVSARVPPFSQGWISLIPGEETSLSCCEGELIAEPSSKEKQAWKGLGKENPTWNPCNERSGLKGREQQEGGEGNPQAGPEDDHEEGAAGE